MNTVTHLLGLALAVIGTAVLVLQAARGGTATKIVGFSVFGLSMICLYLSLIHISEPTRPY